MVHERFGVDYTLPGLDLLLHRLGWSVQVPARQATERDEEQITAWREETWPEVKGRRRTWAPGESSRTSPATGLQAAEGTELGSPRAHPGGAGDRGQQPAAVADRGGGHQAGHRPRLIYRTHRGGRGRRKGFTEGDYAALLDAVH